MDPTDTHLLMSVSKSLTATLIGVLAGEGVLDPSGRVTEYVAALRGTAWEGCTLQHLLDMRAGTRFDEEDYDDPDSDGVLIDEISGYRPLRRPDLPPDTVRLDRRARRTTARTAARSSTARSSPTCSPGRRRRRPARASPTCSRRSIWSRIGAERDAEIIVDAAGFAAAEGGFCTTLRDLARFGLMHLQGGEIGGRRVVPAAWIDRLLTRDDELVAAFDERLAARTAGRLLPRRWWVWDGDAGIYSGYGINGQQLLIHRPSRTVIARFSTWPTR